MSKNSYFSSNSNNEKQRKGRKSLVIVLVVALLLGSNVFTYYLATNGAQSLPGSNISNDEIGLFEELYITKENLDAFYKGEIDEEVLVEGALKGMVSNLGDDYTEYLNSEEMQAFNETTSGNYVGVGIQVGVRDGEVVVIAPFDGSPAQEAGMMSGDVIVEVEGEVIDGDINKATGIMKGEEGVEITVTVKREGENELIDLKMVRSQVEIVTVQGEMIEEGIGYLNISTFDQNTGSNVIAKLDELQDEGATGLILDLRGNPGGTVSSCVEVASQFIPKGEVVVYTEDKYENQKFYDSTGGVAQDMEIVVLIDGGTASASEIVAASLKDYDRATIIGTQSFGKGVVQTLLTGDRYGYGNGAGLKVTTSEYYTPSGTSIHQEGITPDKVVEYPTELREEAYDRDTDPQFEEALNTLKDKMGI